VQAAPSRRFTLFCYAQKPTKPAAAPGSAAIRISSRVRGEKGLDSPTATLAVLSKFPPNKIVDWHILTGQWVRTIKMLLSSHVTWDNIPAWKLGAPKMPRSTL